MSPVSEDELFSNVLAASLSAVLGDLATKRQQLTHSSPLLATALAMAEGHSTRSWEREPEDFVLEEGDQEHQQEQQSSPLMVGPSL